MTWLLAIIMEIPKIAKNHLYTNARPSDAIPTNPRPHPGQKLGCKNPTGGGKVLMEIPGGARARGVVVMDEIVTCII